MEIMYPCKLCVVRACCSHWCDNVMTNPKEIAVHITSTNKCPDCGDELICQPQRYGNDDGKCNPMYICIPCTKVFVHPGLENSPKVDVGYARLITLEDIRNEKTDVGMGVMRFGSGHSRQIIESIDTIIEERLREENPKIPAPDPKEESFPSMMGNTPTVIQKVTLNPKLPRNTRVYGQNTMTSRVWTLDDVARSKTNGDFLISRSGRWVKYYESMYSESSYNGIHTP